MHFLLWQRKRILCCTFLVTTDGRPESPDRGDIVVDGTDQTEDSSLGLSFKQFSLPLNPLSSSKTWLNINSISCCLSIKKKGNFYICCRLTVINTDGKSALICANISEADDHYVLCKYVEFSKTGTCGIGGGSGTCLGTRSWIVVSATSSNSKHNKHCIECRKSILDCALMQDFF